MEIILKRIAKKNTYTIGRLFIVKSEEGRVKNWSFTFRFSLFSYMSGEYRGRTDDLLHAMQAL